MELAANSNLIPVDVAERDEAASMPGHVRWSLIAMTATSSIVMFEPAPCDLAFLLCFPFLFLTGHFVIRKPINPVLYFGGFIFLLMNTISLAMAFEIAPAFRYYAITIYLTIYGLLIVSLVGRYGPEAFETIKRAFIFAAFVTAMIGILARFRMIPHWEMFMLTEVGLRIRSTFKDANVLGPFLVAGSVLILTDVIRFRRIQLWQTVCLSVYCLAIILTFSRGAFLAAAVSWFVLTVLFWWVPQYRAATSSILWRLLPVAALATIVVAVVLFGTGLMDFFFERFSYQSYDDERFLNQQHILETVGRVPAGIGPGSWNKDNFLYVHDVHSLFLRTWVEHGTLGLIGLLIFLFAWCSDVWKRIAKCGRYVHIYIVCGAIFWGIMSNSFSIDTVHWRHFVLFLAIPIGLLAFEHRESTRAT